MSTKPRVVFDMREHFADTYNIPLLRYYYTAQFFSGSVWGVAIHLCTLAGHAFEQYNRRPSVWQFRVAKCSSTDAWRFVLLFFVLYTGKIRFIDGQYGTSGTCALCLLFVPKIAETTCRDGFYYRTLKMRYSTFNSEKQVQHGVLRASWAKTRPKMLSFGNPPPPHHQKTWSDPSLHSKGGSRNPWFHGNKQIKTAWLSDQV